MPSSRRRICVATSIAEPPLRADAASSTPTSACPSSTKTPTPRWSRRPTRRSRRPIDGRARGGSGGGQVLPALHGGGSGRSPRARARVAAVGARRGHAPIESGRRLHNWISTGCRRRRVTDLRRVRGVTGLARHRRPGRAHEARRGRLALAPCGPRTARFLLASLKPAALRRL